MTFGYLGIGLVLLIGIAVVGYGWLADRTDTKRHQDALTSAPNRPIPGLAVDASTPEYLTQDELLHGPAPARAAPAPDLEDLRTRLASAPSVPFGHAAAEFANADGFDDPGKREGGLCVLTTPRVLVTDAAVTSIRELLDFLASAQADGVPVVVVAASMSGDVLATLRVNAVQGKVGLTVVLVPDAVQRSQLASMVGARQVPLADLRAGYLPPDCFGTCGVWVSSRDRVWLVAQI